MLKRGFFRIKIKTFKISKILKVFFFGHTIAIPNKIMKKIRGKRFWFLESKALTLVFLWKNINFENIIFQNKFWIP
ncbi:hypothetical protein BGP_4767 [Beggiatoa sp. PS]|nr:hypothetical protein BGP_4767 [Beggiatoa sp. PS]